MQRRKSHALQIAFVRTTKTCACPQTWAVACPKLSSCPSSITHQRANLGPRSDSCGTLALCTAAVFKLPSARRYGSARWLRRPWRRKRWRHHIHRGVEEWRRDRWRGNNPAWDWRLYRRLCGWRTSGKYSGGSFLRGNRRGGRSLVSASSRDRAACPKPRPKLNVCDRRSGYAGCARH